MTSFWNPRLRLHPLGQPDFDFFRGLAQDERVIRYVGDGQPWVYGYVRQRFQAALDSMPDDPVRHLRWYIAKDAVGNRIGLLALTERPDDTEIGYWIHPDAWGHGYAGELVIHAGRLSRPHLPLTATVHRENTASRRVLERHGFEEAPAADESIAAEVAYRWRPPVVTTVQDVSADRAGGVPTSVNDSPGPVTAPAGDLRSGP